MGSVTVLKPLQAREIPPGANRDRRIKLVRLLRLSEKMVECATEKDWDQLDALEHRRRVDMEECFSGKPEEGESPLIAEAISALIHLNEQLVSLVAQARSEVVSEGSQQRAAKSAVNSYLQADSLR